MRISNKQNNLIARLMSLAETSALGHKHSAALVSGGKVIAVGVNNVKNCWRLGTLSEHAERAVCRTALYASRPRQREKGQQLLLPKEE
jgi:alpha-tubulin suppressor-like RCC1 family protein